MQPRLVTRTAGAVLLLLIGYVAGRSSAEGAVAAQQGARVFELRTYTTPEGKLDLLNARFRDHTRTIFDRHNMTSIGYWIPTEGPTSQTTLVYILAHPSREEAKANWAKFSADPDWKKVRTDSEVGGTILAKPPESVFLKATDYSPIK